MLVVETVIGPKEVPVGIRVAVNVGNADQVPVEKDWEAVLSALVLTIAIEL